MKNDFDFIKDKIENSGVTAPAEIDENHVLKKLEGIEPNSAPILTELKPKKNRARLIAGLAAAFVAVVTLSVFGVIFSSQRQTPIQPTVTQSDNADIPLKTFSDYNEVKEELKKITASSDRILERYEKAVEVDSYENAPEQGSGSSGSSLGMSGGSGSDSHSETYKQVEGVDEADIVKTDGKYLYIASQNGAKGIDIYSATDDPARIVTLYPDNFSDPKKPSAYFDNEDDFDAFVEEMYIYGDRLIAVCNTRGEHFTYSTMAAVFDVSDIKNIRYVDRFFQSGDYTSTRMIGDVLYLVSEEFAYDEDEFSAPLCYRGDDPQEIPIENVRCVENPSDPGMLIIGGYDLKDGAKDVRSTALIGTVEDVYCNESNLYLYSTDWHYTAAIEYEVYDPAALVDSYTSSAEEPITTNIYKVSLDDGITFTACATINGWLDSRYSLDEKDGYLRVAATIEDEKDNKTNALYILDSELKEVGKVTGIAKDEEIKAVRYVGDTAYVITYEETDPLFVIDLSDPKSPTVLGEVKIDGFSTMLVPVDENTLLGVGVYTEDSKNTAMQVENGTKLVLFDVSDKLHPKVLDEKIYRSCESEAIDEPRAFVKNPDRGDYLIPLNYYEYKINKNMDYLDTVVHGGALNFKVENGKIVEIARPEVKVTHDYDDVINRCLYVGDNIYLIYNGYYGETAVYAVKYQ